MAFDGPREDRGNKQTNQDAGKPDASYLCAKQARAHDHDQHQHCRQSINHGPQQAVRVIPLNADEHQHQQQKSAGYAFEKKLHG